MDPNHLKALLTRVQQGDMEVDEALHKLRGLPFQNLGFANVDHHRALRQGTPEVIFSERKTVDQIELIAKEIVKAGQNVLMTRLDETKAEVLSQRLSPFRYASAARIGAVELKPPALRDVGMVAVVTAGTSDIGVAEEAAETLSAIGIEPTRLYDVGVAGLHRLLHRVEDLQKASAVIVIAGMEGALPSVVGGMISAPIVAVPTSVGYGTALSGFTALFTMLTSCASGIVVVNIDSGFGAAMAVHRMLLKRG